MKWGPGWMTQWSPMRHNFLVPTYKRKVTLEERRPVLGLDTHTHILRVPLSPPVSSFFTHRDAVALLQLAFLT